MTDIVNRLRDKHCCDDACHCDEAAAEIERLRAALAPLACTCPAKHAAECSRSEVDCPFWNARAALTAQPAAPGGDND